MTRPGAPLAPFCVWQRLQSPVLAVEDRACVVADYAGVTDRAAFLWPREKAEDFIVGKQAVAMRDLEAGLVSVTTTLAPVVPLTPLQLLGSCPVG